MNNAFMRCEKARQRRHLMIDFKAAAAPAASRGVPANWRARDIRLEDLVYELTPANVAELEALLATLEDKGINYLDTAAGDLPLPGLDSELRSLYAQVRDGAGFVMLRGIPVRHHTKEEIRALAWALACRFGRPVSQNAKGAMIADVMDTLKGGGSPRGYHSNAELRLHTDPASDLIGLCCIEDAKEGGDSTLSNALAVHDEMKARRPDLVDVLYEGFPYNRFGEGLAGEAVGRPREVADAPRRVAVDVQALAALAAR
ncbi:MAG: hypothetical protein EON93_16230, partial [Burkholderiales bacterium]